MNFIEVSSCFSLFIYSISLIGTWISLIYFPHDGQLFTLYLLPFTTKWGIRSIPSSLKAIHSNWCFMSGNMSQHFFCSIFLIFIKCKTYYTNKLIFILFLLIKLYFWSFRCRTFLKLCNVCIRFARNLALFLPIARSSFVVCNLVI